MDGETQMHFCEKCWKARRMVLRKAGGRNSSSRCSESFRSPEALL